MDSTPRIEQHSVLCRFSVDVEITVRVARRSDLPNMEWYGIFSEHRPIIEAAFAAQERGEQTLLVADVAGFPAAQVWIDTASRADTGAGYLWAIRTFPLLQGLGIASRLLHASEGLVAERGLEASELDVEKTNGAAREYYERRGYRLTGERVGGYSYTGADGEIVRVEQDQWTLRKSLVPAPGPESVA